MGATIKSYEDLVNYLRAICKQLKPLNPNNISSPNFYEYEKSFIGKDRKFPCLILLPDSYHVADNKSDNHHLMTDANFFVLDTAAKDDQESRRAALKNAFNIGWEIVSRINQDMRESTREWDPNTIHIDQLPSEMLDASVGYNFALEFGNPKQLRINSDLWYS